ncbi:MAG: ABC transporter ATP-binding protein [Lachnospiraceae bacterium]|nr:ABC transporter ATP-binding protein [Lachnospiraceae bacterium]
MSEAIFCKDLNAYYDKSRGVLDGVNIRINEGESVCILGSNGSGKSTLLKAIIGIIPYEGEVKINGKDIKGMSRREIATNVAVMTQLSQVYFSYSVMETVLLGRYLHIPHFFGKPNEKDMEICRNALRKVGMEKLADRQIGSLSGGELQRVFLARTFAQEAPILLLDEPTNHLDLKVVSELSEHLNEWRREPGHTLIGVYHDISLALKLSDRGIFIKDGKVLGEEKTENILTSDIIKETYDFDVYNYLKS